MPLVQNAGDMAGRDGSEAALPGEAASLRRASGCQAAGQGLPMVLLRKSLERLVMVPNGAVG